MRTGSAPEPAAARHGRATRRRASGQADRAVHVDSRRRGLADRPPRIGRRQAECAAHRLRKRQHHAGGRGRQQQREAPDAGHAMQAPVEHMTPRPRIRGDRRAPASGRRPPQHDTDHREGEQSDADPADDRPPGASLDQQIGVQRLDPVDQAIAACGSSTASETGSTRTSRPGPRGPDSGDKTHQRRLAGRRGRKVARGAQAGRRLPPVPRR